MKLNIVNVATLMCAMQNKKILVIGDVMLDRFIDGSYRFRQTPPILSQSRVVTWQAGC